MAAPYGSRAALRPNASASSSHVLTTRFCSGVSAKKIIENTAIATGNAAGSVVLSLIYAAVRRSGSRWWLWATGLSFVFLLIAQLIAPVYFLPLLNDYKPLPEGPIREAVLSLARANGVPTSHVEWFDASKQTTRVSANVAGLLGTTRIALNDNLDRKSVV
jgi:STE24 endopeptidase